MSIKSELLALKDNDGLIVAEVAVEWARAHPKSDLYAAFNWDTGWNVEQYLLVQMRKLITLNIVTEEGAPQVVSLTIDRTQPRGGYREVSDVVKNRKLRDIMLTDALAELERVRSRYESVLELVEVWAAVDRVRRKVKKEKGGDERRIA